MNKEHFPLLVTGLLGIPGYNAFSYFRNRYTHPVIGIRPSHNNTLKGNGIVPISAEDFPKLTELFATYKFKTIIDASGCCALKSCEFDKETATLVNRDLGVKIAELAGIYQSRLLRFSTDLVFAGREEGLYAETSSPCPITIYGKTMYQAEIAIRQMYPPAVILRIALPMGPSFNGHAGPIDWIESRFKKGLHATLFYDEIRSNIYIQDILKVLEWFIENKHKGLFHLGGPKVLSLYQIAQIINKLGNYDPDLLKGSFRREAYCLPPRVGNVSMNTHKITSLLPKDVIKPWPYNPQQIPTDRRWHFKRNGSGNSRDAIKKELNGYKPNQEERHPIHWH